MMSEVEAGCKEFTLHRVKFSCMLMLTISEENKIRNGMVDDAPTIYKEQSFTGTR